MSKQQNSSATPSLATTTTRLPGLTGQQVIVSSPQLVKENSQYSTTNNKSK